MTKPNQMTVACLGGDARQMYAAQALKEQGFSVRLWGLSNAVTATESELDRSPTWQAAIAGSDAMILPLPATRDGVHVLTAPGKEPLRLDHLLASMGGGVLLGGRLPETLLASAEAHGIRCVDYYRSETLQVKNALPTAEGAIALALTELPVTLCGTSVAVLGYGRIGSLLSARLHAFGAHVTVAARRREVMAMAALMGGKSIDLGNRSALTSALEEVRVIFNTVPTRLLDAPILSRLRRDVLIIDLASAPGGLEHAEAERLGLRTIWATALPGKIAPESAGRYLGEEMARLLQEIPKERR